MLWLPNSAGSRGLTSRLMVEQVIVRPGEAADLGSRDPRETLGLPDKAEANERLDTVLTELSDYQKRCAGSTPRFPEPQFEKPTII